MALGRDDFLGSPSLSSAFVFDLERNVFFWISLSALLSSGSDLVTDFDLDLTFAAAMVALGRDDFLGTSSLSSAFVFDLERNVFFWISPSALTSSGSDLVTDFDLDLTFAAAMVRDESESLSRSPS